MSDWFLLAWMGKQQYFGRIRRLIKGILSREDSDIGHLVIIYSMHKIPCDQSKKECLFPFTSSSMRQLAVRNQCKTWRATFSYETDFNLITYMSGQYNSKDCDFIRAYLCCSGLLRMKFNLECCKSVGGANPDYDKSLQWNKEIYWQKWR